jgi:hypothetical protein
MNHIVEIRAPTVELIKALWSFLSKGLVLWFEVLTSRSRFHFEVLAWLQVRILAYHACLGTFQTEYFIRRHREQVNLWLLRYISRSRLAESPLWFISWRDRQLLHSYLVRPQISPMKTDTGRD